MRTISSRIKNFLIWICKFVIRWVVILLLFAFFCNKGASWITGNILKPIDYVNNAFENYEPKIIKETTELPSIDTTANFWERLFKTKYKGKSAIIYLDIKDDFKIPDELIYLIESDGKWIKTRTYNTETNKRSSYNYPYYKYFQITAPKTIIYSRDYFDWERLSILMDYNPIDNFEIKAISELRFNPWSLSMGIYATSQGKCGITLKKRLW